MFTAPTSAATFAVWAASTAAPDTSRFQASSAVKSGQPEPPTTRVLPPLPPMPGRPPTPVLVMVEVPQPAIPAQAARPAQAAKKAVCAARTERVRLDIIMFLSAVGRVDWNILHA